MTDTSRSNQITLAAIAAAMSVAMTAPVWAAGSNTTSPAPTPVTPTRYPSMPQLSTVGAGGCVQQYTSEDNSLNQNAINANNVGLAANGVGAAAAVVGVAASTTAAIADEVAYLAGATDWAIGGAAMIAGGATLVGTPAGVVAGGVAMEAAAAIDATHAVATGAKIAALAAEAVGVASTVTGVASQVVAQGHTQNSQNLAVYVASLPDCEATHTGTVAVTDGGVNVTGTSIATTMSASPET